MFSIIIFILDNKYQHSNKFMFWKLKRSFFWTHIFNQSQNLHDFVKPSLIVQVVFLYHFCKTTLASMQRSFLGDFWYYSNRVIENIPDKTLQFLYFADWNMRYGIIHMEDNMTPNRQSKIFFLNCGLFELCGCAQYFLELIVLFFWRI